jgi:glycerophosphoryl diester phosphodiesterase
LLLVAVRKSSSRDIMGVEIATIFCFVTVLVRKRKEYRMSQKSQMRRHVERVAHRGGSQLAPQNTLAAFRNALTLPIDAIELDVHLSRDGQAIVFHDYTVDKLTNGHGNILDLDFAYLRGLNAAAHFPGGWLEPQQIPTLREVLELAKGHARVYIETKPSNRNGVYGSYPHMAETVVAELSATDMLEHVLVMSFDWTVLPQIKALEPALQTGALVSNDQWDAHAGNALENLSSQVATLGCQWINMDAKLFTAEMPVVFHKHNYKLGLWTVDSIHKMQRFAEAGVDSLTTDRPDLFAQLSL